MVDEGRTNKFNKIKEKSVRTKQSFPRHCWSDNCCSDAAKLIKEIFKKDPITGLPHKITANQDIKHLADRLTETLVKANSLYLTMAQDPSAAITNDGISFHLQSRTGIFR